MPTKLWSVRTALLSTFAAPVAAAGGRLFDGQRKAGAVPKLYLVVGADGDDLFGDPGDTVDVLAGTARQEWAREGPGDWRAEAGDVLCTIVAWSGGTDFAVLRTTAAALLTACELALRADPDLNVLLGSGAELGEIRLWERRTAKGSGVGVVFAVTYQSILERQA